MRFHLLDAVGLVVGYGLASLLVRAYWPTDASPSGWETLFIAVVFTWVGMAMSGPLVLVSRRPTLARVDPDPDERVAPSRSWAEIAWLMIGSYWMILTVVVVPSRMNGVSVLDSAFLGVFPVAVALAIRFLGPLSLRRTKGDLNWTHHAGVWLLATWPFAWVALIALGSSLL